MPWMMSGFIFDGCFVLASAFFVVAGTQAELFNVIASLTTMTILMQTQNNLVEVRMLSTTGRRALPNWILIPTVAPV